MQGIIPLPIELRATEVVVYLQNIYQKRFHWMVFEAIRTTIKGAQRV